MKIRIKRFDQSIDLPQYKSSGAAAFDLASRVDVVVSPRSIAYIPLNVAIEPPKGYFVMLVPRSSLHKRGLMPANGIGIIDADYSGDHDEYTAALYNFTDKDVEIGKGERIMQAVVTPLSKVEIIEVHSMRNADRGGFGSTGVD